MNEEKKSESVEETGASENVLKSSPSSNNLGDFDAGKLQKSSGLKSEEKKDVNLDNYVEKKSYEELQKKLTDQGDELGEYRKWFKDENVSRLLDKLNENPEIVEAILDNKFDSKLAEAVLADKVKIEDATEVAEAHEEVKKELGTKEYEDTSPEEIEKLISEKIEKKTEEIRRSLENNISDLEKTKEFNERTNDFVKNTKDFTEYADEINEWFEEHPDQYDIEVAYNNIKGKHLIKKSEKEEGANAGEVAKDLAANAAGGQSQGTSVPDKKNAIEELISPIRDPNIF